MSSPLIAIVGPTAVGKTELAFKLASVFGGEIVNADSRQIYRRMDIGTAKPSASLRAQIPHHLIDIVNPDDTFSLGTYKKLACDAIDDIISRQKLPILVGGTGQYIWSLLEGWTVPEVPPDKHLRESLENIARSGDSSSLFEQLQQIDPIAACRIDHRNVRRVIRALEIYQLTGSTPSGLQKKVPPPWNTLIIGLNMDREGLYKRADKRIDDMVQNGWVDEVKNLITLGYRSNLPSMSSVGYREIKAYINNEISLADAIQKIKWNTHKFIRHQYAWFRLSDSRIDWIDANKGPAAVALRIIKEKYPDLHTICATI